MREVFFLLPSSSLFLPSPSFSPFLFPDGCFALLQKRGFHINTYISQIREDCLINIFLQPR